MLTLTNAQAIALGYTVKHSEAGLPRIIGPTGEHYVRALLGKPALVLVAEDGKRYSFTRSTWKTTSAFARIMRASKRNQ